MFAERFNRRGFMRMAGTTTLGAAVLAACKKAEDTSGAATGTSGAAAHPPIDKEPGNLAVFDWSGYGNGDYYPNKERASLWQSYADQTGDTPQFTLFANDDEGYTKAIAGTVNFDVVHPCGYKYKDWVDADLMQPWDTSLIPNYAQLNPKLMTSGVVEGKQYFIPLDWGFIAPLVNTDYVDVGDEQSFGILFDEQYAGKISWVDTSNMMYIGGLFLGVSDPFNMTDDELGQVRDFLISKKPLVKFMWSQSYDFWLAFKKEEVWIGYSWPDTVGYADAAGMNYLYMEPKEGRVSWVCGMGLAKNTPNYYHAHDYVNSWASKKAAEFLLAWYYYGHTNTTADLSVVSPGIVQALGLDDPTVLDPPKAIPESYIPRRPVYEQYWGEVTAA